ncbi:MAG: hypothetical protein JO329_05700 [Planctomycetaceae bacterium]|nr:hypothetical protein [Planctomycetaceae bacterium]
MYGPAAPRADCRDGAAGHTDGTQGEWHDWHRNPPIAFTQLNINKDKIESLAQALAAGDSAASWAEVNNVPRRTAYRWAAEAGVKVRVRGLRQGLVTDAVGKLAGAATAAVENLRGLLAEGQLASVRLGAARAILTALIDVQTHAELADLVAHLVVLADAQRQDEA